MALLASDCMTEACSLLNDQAQALYTFGVQLPFLKKANEDLELIMIASGLSVQRQEQSTPIQVPASTVNQALNLATVPDMFVPIRLLERNSGSSDLFVQMEEREWEPNIQGLTTIAYWTFRNNNIYFPPLLANREVKLDYWRQLAVIANSGSTEEIIMAKTYLAARTAELCARYIGENSERADSLRDNEVSQAQDNLIAIYTKNSQGGRTRRRRFTRSRTTYTR